MDKSLTIYPRGSVIDHLMKAPSGEQRVVAYFFFDYRWKESLSAITFLRCILHQVLRMDKIPAGIRERLQRHFGGANDSHEPTLENLLQKLIFDVCASLNDVFFFIDGLDEAEPDCRSSVLQFLEYMQPHVKIFIAGQPEIDIAALFKSSRAATIDIAERDVKGDIWKFINIKLEQDVAANEVLSNYDPCFIDHIKAALASKAQGM